MHCNKFEQVNLKVKIRVGPFLHFFIGKSQFFEGILSVMELFLDFWLVPEAALVPGIHLDPI